MLRKVELNMHAARLQIAAGNQPDSIETIDWPTSSVVK
jgi:hypothetical protein